jgi:hypothetical protein
MAPVHLDREQSLVLLRAGCSGSGLRGYVPVQIHRVKLMFSEFPGGVLDTAGN